MTWDINGILMGVSGWVGGCIPSQPVKNSRKSIEEEEEFPIRAIRGSKLHYSIIPLFVCVHVCDVYWSITGQPLADQRSSTGMLCCLFIGPASSFEIPSTTTTYSGGR